MEELLEANRGVAAVWQMEEADCSPGVIRHAVAPMREVHNGVFVSGHGPPTDWQLWKAATLTAPGTFVADWSAASLLTMRERPDRMPTTAVRNGSGSTLRIAPKPGRIGSLHVRRAIILPNEVIDADGIPTISVPRTTLDLIARIGEPAANRLIRDVLRKKLATPTALRACHAQHYGERGVARMKSLVDLYGPLGLGRSKSDAEGLALSLFAEAGIAPPAHNVYIAGEEADFAWFNEKHILEVDGPQYHQFPERDAKKQAAWEDAGWSVSRVPSGDVYDRPHLLLAAAEPPDRDQR